MTSGEVAIVSQSGVTFLALGKVAKEKGFGISKGISYGSEGDARVNGFLNYLAEDPKTKIVAIYIEGVRDGASFLGSLKKLAARKPAIVLKGGVTDAGARAVASHSGAMAGRGEVWPVVFRKAGAIQADNLEEMVDLVLGFLHLGNITGNRLCIVTPSGGAAVMYSDACFRAGFQLPTLREESRASIKNALPPGTNVKNPVDVAQGYFRHEVMQQVLSLVAADENIDFILFHLPMDVFISTVEHAPWVEEKFFGYLLCGKNHAKPFMVVLPYTVADGKRAEVEQYLLRNEIAVFPTVERALKVVSKLQAYSSVQQDMGE
jgi:acyl-CoA synthetase (NDP forming)